MRSRNCSWRASRSTKALRSQIVFFAAISLSAAASAQTGLQPAAADDIAGAVIDCWNAVGEKAVDRRNLEAAGWQFAPGSDSQGKPVSTPLSLYARAGRQAAIMIAEGSSTPMCSVIARVASPDDLGKAAGAIQKKLVALNPQVKATRDGESLVFLALPKLAMADSTGSKDKPAIRIVVGYQNPEKK